MHVPCWPPFKLLKKVFCRTENLTATGLEKQEMHTQTSSRAQRPSPLSIDTPAVQLEVLHVAAPSESNKQSDIPQAYAIARIARTRLQREAERKDHDLRLLVGHANLLDQLAETIEEEEPDFDVDNLEPYVDHSPVTNDLVPKTIHRGRIDALLRIISLPEDADDESLDDLDEEIYDESEDDLEEPTTPEKEDFGADARFSTQLMGFGMVSNVAFSLKQARTHTADDCKIVGQSWVEYNSQASMRRTNTMPVVTVTALADDT